MLKIWCCHYLMRIRNVMNTFRNFLCTTHIHVYSIQMAIILNDEIKFVQSDTNSTNDFEIIISMVAQHIDRTK